MQSTSASPLSPAPTLKVGAGPLGPDLGSSPCRLAVAALPHTLRGRHKRAKLGLALSCMLLAGTECMPVGDGSVQVTAWQWLPTLTSGILVASSCCHYQGAWKLISIWPWPVQQVSCNLERACWHSPEKWGGKSWMDQILQYLCFLLYASFDYKHIVLLASGKGQEDSNLSLARGSW